MSIHQISVFLENKPGKLKEMTSVLAEHEIDMRALSLAETMDFGIARIIVDDAYQALNVLNDNGFIAKINHVLAVAVPDVPGGLDKLLTCFSEANINIEYMYAFMGAGTKQAYMIFRVTEHKAAEAKLAAKGLRFIAEEDLANA